MNKILMIGLILAVVFVNVGTGYEYHNYPKISFDFYGVSPSSLSEDHNRFGNTGCQALRTWRYGNDTVKFFWWSYPCENPSIVGGGGIGTPYMIPD